MSPRGGAQVSGFIDSGSGWDGAGALMMGAGTKGDPMMDDRKPEPAMSGKAAIVVPSRDPAPPPPSRRGRRRPLLSRGGGGFSLRRRKQAEELGAGH